jgi:hypothetical protein
MSTEIINSIFDPTARESFEFLLRQLNSRWNLPFTPVQLDARQVALF